MKRKLAVLLLVSTCVFNLVGFSACELLDSFKNSDSSTIPTEVLAYTLNDDGESYTVSAADGYLKQTDLDLVIPATYNDKPVTKVSENMFYYCSGLNSLVIPDSVTSIGEQAFFNCTNLKKITIGTGIVSIGEQAFLHCMVTQAKIPAIAINYISQNYLSKVEIISGSIDDDAFSSNSRLNTLIIGNEVTSIGNKAFANCTKLTDVTIHDGVTVIGEQAFIGCTGLTGIIIPDSVTFIGGDVFTRCNQLKTIILGNGIHTIKEYSFYNCTALQSIAIPNSIITIEQNAFEKCKNLKNIVIGKNIKTIAEYAFWECESLETVFYKGTSSNWNAISIEAKGNPSIRLTAQKYYYSETQATGCWRYVNNVPTVW